MVPVHSTKQSGTTSQSHMHFMFYGASSFNNQLGIGILPRLHIWGKCCGPVHSTKQSGTGTLPRSRTCMACLLVHHHSTNQLGIDTSSVTHMGQMFKGASSFNQNVSGWNIEKVTLLGQIFADVPALTNFNKGLIHEKFSINSNWGHDWSALVPPRNLTPLAQLAILENQPSGTIVGEFNATDSNDGNITYHFVNGENNNSSLLSIQRY